MKIDNRGLSLVELIVSMGITFFIVVAITIFMANSLKSYSTADAEITVQSEAQSVLNHLVTVIQEGNNIMIDDITHTVIVYHNQKDGNEQDDPIEIIWWNSVDQCLYLFSDITVADTGTVMSSISSGSVSDDQLLGEYISNFSAWTTLASSPNTFPENCTEQVVSIQIALIQNSITFEATGQAKLRNRLEAIPTPTP